MEGADAIVWPEQVHEWWENGLRVVSLSHYGFSAYSHGTATGTDGGLFPPAKPLLEKMDKLGMILDVSHTSDASVREELDIFGGPLLASHQNCRAVTPGERQQPDDILKAVIDRGGVIGASMDTWMIYKGGLDWSERIPSPWEVFPRDSVTLEDYVDHIDHVCQLAGSSEHAAIGGDTDGQGGVPEAPVRDRHGCRLSEDRRRTVGPRVQGRRRRERHVPQLAAVLREVAAVREGPAVGLPRKSGKPRRSRCDPCHRTSGCPESSCRYGHALMMGAIYGKLVEGWSYS